MSRALTVCRIKSRQRGVVTQKEGGGQEAGTCEEAAAATRGPDARGGSGGAETLAFYAVGKRVMQGVRARCKCQATAGILENRWGCYERRARL